MAITSTLILEGKTPGYNVMECEYEFKQPIDNNLGKPCGDPWGGIIVFTILAPSKNDTVFHEWMLSKTLMKSGVFIFNITIGAEKNEKIVSFEQAHCIGLREYFNNQNTNQMLAKITITAHSISFGKKDATFKNPLF